MNRDYWRGRVRGLREAVDVIEAGLKIGLPTKDALEVPADVAGTIEYYVKTKSVRGLRSLLNRRESKSPRLP